MGELNAITAVDTLTLSGPGLGQRLHHALRPDRRRRLRRRGAVLMSLGWHRSFGSLDLAEPDAFVSLVGRQPQLAAEATHIVLARLKRAFAETDALTSARCP